jgi:hypothetical protein
MKRGQLKGVFVNKTGVIYSHRGSQISLLVHIEL